MGAKLVNTMEKSGGALWQHDNVSRERRRDYNAGLVESEPPENKRLNLEATGRQRDLTTRRGISGAGFHRT